MAFERLANGTRKFLIRTGFLIGGAGILLTVNNNREETAVNTAKSAKVVGGGIAETGGAVVTIVSVFVDELDFETEDLPSIDINTSNSNENTTDINSEYIVEPGDSYWSILGGLGLSASEIVACDANVDFGSLGVLTPGQNFTNPCL